MKASLLTEGWRVIHTTEGREALVRRWINGAAFVFPAATGRVYEVCLERDEWTHVQRMVREVFEVGDTWRDKGEHGAVVFAEQWCGLGFAYVCRRRLSHSTFVFRLADNEVQVGEFEFAPGQMGWVIQ